MKKIGESIGVATGRRSRKRKLAALAVAIFHVLGLLSSIHAVMETRTPQGAIAWGVALNTLPYVSVPAYWVFGRSRFQGYVTSRRAGDARVRDLASRAAEILAPYRVAETEAAGPPGGTAAERLAGLPYLKGNAVDLLVDGEATFESILRGIDEAEKYVLFQFYIVHDDGLGRAVKDRLVARAKEGVRVYFLYDEVGSHDLPESYRAELRAAGIEVRDFHTRKGRGNRFQLNFRNHRKVVVVDGKRAWVGGHNVGDEYLGKDPKIGRWRDTHIRIEGPAVLAAQLSFAEDWHWAAGSVPDLDWDPVPSASGDIPVLVVPTGPADELETAALMFIHAINRAQKRIWIATPYFVPDMAVIYALQLAGLRGVDVRILIPREPDSLLTQLSAYAYLKDAGATGVRFFHYTDGFLHEKAMLIDDRYTAVGTANFDNRSFRLNFEITGIVVDEGFAAEAERMFEADFARSEEVPSGALEEKPFWFRLAVRLASLTAPVQ